MSAIPIERRGWKPREFYHREFYLEVCGTSQLCILFQSLDPFDLRIDTSNL